MKKGFFFNVRDTLWLNVLYTWWSAINKHDRGDRQRGVGKTRAQRIFLKGQMIWIQGEEPEDYFQWRKYREQHLMLT